LRGLRCFAEICRAASSVRVLKALGQKIFRNDPPIDAMYYHRFGLNKEDVKSGATFMFLVTFTVSFVLLSQLIGFISFFVSLLFGFTISAWFQNLIPRRVEREKILISYQVPLVLQEMILASAGTGSIFDLITFVARGRHPVTSRAFARIASHVSNGAEPERLVKNYANHQPCQSLRRYLVDAVSVGLEWDELKKVIKERRGEAEFEYQKYTMQVETRMLLIVGLGTFWPIIFSIAVLVNGSWSGQPSMILAAFIFVLLLIIMENRLMKPIRKAEILGASVSFSRAKGLLGHTAKEELQEVIIVLSLLGEALHREKASPELAIKRVSEMYNGWLNPLLAEMVHQVFYDGVTLRHSLLWFKNRFSNVQCRQIIRILPQMFEKTAEHAGERLIEVVSYIKENQGLIEERENIVKAQRFKAKLLSFFSPATLGLVSALSPLFTILSTRQIALTAFKPLIWTYGSIVTTIVLLTMTIINTFNVMRTVGAKKPIISALVAAAIFLTVFVFSIRLMNGLA